MRSHLPDAPVIRTGVIIPPEVLKAARSGCADAGQQILNIVDAQRQMLDVARQATLDRDLDQLIEQRMRALEGHAPGAEPRPQVMAVIDEVEFTPSTGTALGHQARTWHLLNCPVCGVAWDVIEGGVCWYCGAPVGFGHAVTITV